MISEERLQIGDMVYYTDPDCDQTHACEVRGLLPNGRVGIWFKGYQEVIGNYLSPIPLTEEILYANGYTREIVGDTVHFVSPDRRLILQNDPRYLNSNREWYIHIDSVAMSTVGSAEFTYFHELQHIMYFFGFETILKFSNS